MAVVGRARAGAPARRKAGRYVCADHATLTGFEPCLITGSQEATFYRKELLP